jgi:iron complex transport system substrate-binding protein
MLRVVSLIPSATEIVAALGLGQAARVGRSHECDFPAGVERLPPCTAPSFDPHGSSREIDRRVKDRLERALSIYDVDQELLRALAPDVIITQAQCEVCAVDLGAVEKAVSGWVGSCPQLVSLTPNSLRDIFADIRKVARALGVDARGETLCGELQRRLDTIAEKAAGAPRRPRVACIEWLDPLMAAGNWLPELVALAGGHNLFGTAGAHSPWLEPEALWASKPEVTVLMPCGFSLAKTLEEARGFPRQGRVYAVDGNQYFNRPGPRLVESLEILAEILHPDLFAPAHAGKGFVRLEEN